MPSRRRWTLTWAMATCTTVVVAAAVGGCGATTPADWHRRAVRQDGQGFADTVARTVGRPPGRQDCAGAFLQRLRHGGQMVDGYDPSGDDRLAPADEHGWVDACAAAPWPAATRASVRPRRVRPGS